jgi:hypothetical protein
MGQITAIRLMAVNTLPLQTTELTPEQYQDANTRMPIPVIMQSDLTLLRNLP